MKICYLTWGETPRSYGIFGSQVLGQFIKTSELMPEDDFHFISAVPLIHSGFLREKLNYRHELQKIATRLNQIKFHTIPIYAPQNFINSTRITFKFMHSGSHWHLKSLLKNIKPDVVHCRSYHAAWAALKVKEKYDLDYKIVFDGRGLWPEEIALKKSFEVNGISFNFLKKIEKKLLDNCDISVAVSDTMYEHYQKISSVSNRKIYLSTDVSKLLNTNDIKKVTNNLSLCYVGALTEDTWHTTSELLRLFESLNRIFKSKIELLIITTSDHQAIKNIFTKYKKQLNIISTKSADELKSALNNIDFGLLPYRSNLTGVENIIGETMLGTKTVEYIAAGLTVLVNKYCGGAASIIEENNLGLSYDPNSLEELRAEDILNKLTALSKVQRNEIAKKLFDYGSNADKYKRIYKSLS